MLSRVGSRVGGLLVREPHHMLIPRAGMAGHSKWSTIKRQKGAEDMKRAAVFQKISRALRVAVNTGIDQNIQNVLQRAHAVKMPKEVIQRALEKANQAKQGNTLRYEGTGPHGITVIVSAISDNKARTVALIKEAFNKGGGSMTLPNSQSFKFSRIGQVTVSEVVPDKADDLMANALEFGAEEVDETGQGEGEWVVTSSVEDLGKMETGLREAGFNVASSGIVQKPLALVPVEGDEARAQVERFLDMLDDVEDTDEVFHDADLGGGAGEE